MDFSFERIERIQTRQELVLFLEELYRECCLNGNSWENHTLERFLEALAGWTHDMDGFYLNRNQPVPQQPQWKTFAHMLAAATMYE